MIHLLNSVRYLKNRTKIGYDSAMGDALHHLFELAPTLGTIYWNQYLSDFDGDARFVIEDIHFFEEVFTSEEQMEQAYCAEHQPTIAIYENVLHQTHVLFETDKAKEAVEDFSKIIFELQSYLRETCGDCSSIFITQRGMAIERAEQYE